MAVCDTAALTQTQPTPSLWWCRLDCSCGMNVLGSLGVVAASSVPSAIDVRAVSSAILHQTYEHAHVLIMYPNNPSTPAHTNSYTLLTLCMKAHVGGELRRKQHARTHTYAYLGMINQY